MVEPSDVAGIIDADAYRGLSSLEKRDFLFETGIRPTAYAPGDMPDVLTGVVEFAESAHMSFQQRLLPETVTRVADELETPKRKLFHTYGTTAKVRFEPRSDTPYSGLFAETARGLVRFSYAGPVVGVGIVPGLGLKLTLDGDHPSANAVLMRGLDPQLSRSVFDQSFTNRLPNPSPVNLIMREVKRRFETVVTDGHGLDQPVTHLASVRVDGRPVPDDAVRAPFRLILVPTAAVRAAHDPLLDFRDDLARHVASGTQLYDVLALDADADGEDELEAMIPVARAIGALTTESEFIASAYGDFRLFFQHSDAYLRRANF